MGKGRSGRAVAAREAAAPSPAAAQPSTAPEKPATPRAWYSEKAALLGGGILLVLSNIATLLRLFGDISDAAGVVHSWVPAYLPFWLIASTTALVVLLGNVLLARYLYQRFAAHQITQHKVMAVIVIAVVVTCMLLVNLLSWRKLRPDVKKIQSRLTSELLEAQSQGQVAGFGVSVGDLSGQQDAWTAAQAVDALTLSDAASNRESIRAGLEYLKRSRAAAGWAGDPNPDHPPFVRPEISSWVILAHVQALRSGKIWTAAEIPEVAARVSTYADELVSFQDRDTGAWSPVNDQLANHDRTYATSMAVWALSEAYTDPNLDPELKAKIGSALDGGTNWLLRNYRPGYGWDENPNMHVDDRFTGLNFLTFFVLKRVEAIDGRNEFKNFDSYEELKTDFISNMQPAPVSDQIEIPTSDIVIGGKPCWATFLGYPWSLALLSELKKDQSLTSAQRRKVEDLAGVEAQRLPQVPKYLEHTFTWKVAEYLIGISYVNR